MKNQDALTESRAAYVSLLKQSLQRVVDTMSSLQEVERVSLFGSFARGRADLLTDLDIVIVMNTDKTFSERLRMLYSLLALPVDADILCYTPEEFEELQQSPFFKQILREEVVLYAKKPT